MSPGLSWECGTNEFQNQREQIDKPIWPKLVPKQKNKKKTIAILIWKWKWLSFFVLVGAADKFGSVETKERRQATTVKRKSDRFDDYLKQITCRRVLALQVGPTEFGPMRPITSPPFLSIGR